MMSVDVGKMLPIIGQSHLVQHRRLVQAHALPVAMNFVDSAVSETQAAVEHKC